MHRVMHRVMRDARLWQCRIIREVESYQATKLFELLPLRPNGLWQTDITWVHVPGFGWWYAVTVIDYFSRYLLACRFSGSHTASDLQSALDMACREAVRIHGSLERLPTLESDNGPSFMSRSFRFHVKGRFNYVRIAYRTPTQLGLLERVHQTLRTEEVYWCWYENPGAARRCLEEFRVRYNETRPHWALKPLGGGDVLVPSEVYVDGLAVGIPSWQGWAKAAKKKLDEVVGGDHFPPIGPTGTLDSVA
ncbi:MAG: DDE-type integrase/transposase/recombinase [Acidiferrobacterales bacterium]|nr:DDE-type integrase/transposase/recombinase [Acidiferrobacterales bacterium]